MPTAVDDDKQTTEPNAEDVAAASPSLRRRSRSAKLVSTDTSHQSSGETTIGVVTTPGQGGEPEIVSGYFVTLDDQGVIVNNTGIPTESLLKAAQTFDLPIYVKKNGQVYPGRLDPSGQAVTSIANPITPGNDLTRALQQPAGEQLRLMSQHLDNMEAVEHLTAPPSPTKPVQTAPSAQPTVQIPIRSVSSVQPTSPPIQASPPPSTSSPLSFDIPSVPPVPSTSTSSTQVTIPQSGSSEGRTGSITVPVPSVEVIDDEQPSPAFVGTPAPASPASPSASPLGSPAGTPASTPPTLDTAETPESPSTKSSTPPIPRSAEEVSPATNPEAFASPTGPSFPDTPGTIGLDDQVGQLSESNRSTKPRSVRAAPAVASSSPTFGRRPRRDGRSPRPSLPDVTKPATEQVAPPVSPAQAETSTASPAIAPGAPLGVSTPVSTSAGQTSVPTDMAQPTGASTTTSPTVSPAGDQSSPVRSQTSSSHDHQAARPRTDDAQFPIQPNLDESVGEQAIDQDHASPAFVPGGQPKIPTNKTEPESSTGDEQIDQTPTQEPIVRTPAPGPRTDSGPIMGFNDPRTFGPEAYKPLTASSSGAPEPPTAGGAETPSANSTEVVSGEQQQAAGGQLRANKVEAQRRAQWESNDRVRQWKAIQQGQKAKQIPVMYESKAEATAKIYKRLWQIAQEVAEDTALSMSDLFLFSGPVVVGLYVVRWMGGNMMGRLFTFQYMGVELERVPGYSLSDPVDYIRHMKFLVVAAWTGLIYGTIFGLLWLVNNPEEALKIGFTNITAIVNFFTGQ